MPHAVSKGTLTQPTTPYANRYIILFHQFPEQQTLTQPTPPYANKYIILFHPFLEPQTLTQPTPPYTNRNLSPPLHHRYYDRTLALSFQHHHMKYLPTLNHPYPYKTTGKSTPSVYSGNCYALNVYESIRLVSRSGNIVQNIPALKQALRHDLGPIYIHAPTHLIIGVHTW